MNQTNRWLCPQTLSQQTFYISIQEILAVYPKLEEEDIQADIDNSSEVEDSDRQGTINSNLSPNC